MLNFNYLIRKIMSLKLNQSNVTPDSPVFQPMLNNLQANILKGHGRNFAHHLFIQIQPGKVAQAKQWIKTFAAQTITSAKTQIEATDLFNAGSIPDGGTVFTLSLSAAAYDLLGITGKPASNTFRNGMAANAALLGDDPANWDPHFKQTQHILIIVADDHAKTAKEKAQKIIKEIKTFGKLILDQKGNVLKMSNGTGIEHFGYADGVSQPLYLKEDIDRQISTNEWDDTTNLDRLLVPDTTTPVPDSFGSYFVFRKLEQNVKGFKTAEGDNGRAQAVCPVINDATNTPNPDLGGAMIVGRFESSTPVVKKSIDNISNPPVITNDFNYADDLQAVKCPFHAHTRLMNPRDGDTVAGDVRSHRITRRGMPYDEAGRIPEKKITKITDEMLDRKQPTKDVGLLFMCYQESIENHFEILQGFWANRGQIGGHNVNGQDSIIGQGSNPPKTLPARWNHAPQTASFSMSGFVKNKGGEYFFTPSISTLKTLS